MFLLVPQAQGASKGNDPVAYWRFDEGGGPTAYDDISTNDGTLTPGDNTGSNDTAGEMWAAGKIGNALECDGTNDYVDCDGDSLFNPGSDSYTVTVWMKTNSNSNLQYIWSKEDGGANAFSPLLNHPSSGKIYWYIRGTNNKDVETSSTVITDTNWHHAAFVLNRTEDNAYIYVDGEQVLQQSIANVGSISASSSFWIGRIPWSASYPFNGLIDDVRIYNYARTAAQVMVDYNAGAAAHLGSGADPNEGNAPVAYYSMDNLSGANLYDESGSGNNGTITGATAAQGKHGMALNFDGDDYVSTSITSSFSALTVTAWVKCSDVTWSRDGSDVQEFIAKWESGNKSFDFRMTDGQMEVLISPGADSNGEQETSTLSLASDRWTFVAFTYDDTANTVTIYKDDSSETFSNAVTMGGSTGIQIGRLTWSGTTQRNFKGLIDEVKIYDYARTQAQIAYDYSKGAPIAHYRFDEGTGSIAHNAESSANSGAAPVAWWRMDTASSGAANGATVSDESGNANNGTADDGANNTGMSWTSGKIGPGALDFDGTDDKVNLGSDVVGSISGDYTVEAWAKPAALDAGRHTIFSWSYMELGQDGSNAYFWQAYDGSWGSGYQYISTTAPLDTTSFHHFVGVHKEDVGVDLYVDGVYIGTDTTKTGSSLNISGTSYLGVYYTGTGGYFNGDIDDVRIYDYARTAEQIYNDYKSTHGTFVGDTKFVDGKIGKALEFDGSGDYVDCGSDASLDVQTAITVEAWIKHTSLSADTSDFVSKYSGTGGYSFTRYQDEALFFVYSSGYYLYAYDVFEVGKWVHIAYTADNTTSGSTAIKSYVNGKLWSQVTQSIDIGTTTNHLYMGAKGHYGGYHNGLMDDVRIYNYVRTAAQVKQDYDAGAASRHGAQRTGVADPWGGDLPVGHWRMDENTGVLACDASENANDGTLGGDGAGTDVPTWTNGKHGPGLSFDGGDYVEISDDIDLNINVFTLACWAKSNVAGSSYTNYGFMVNKGSFAGNGYGIMVNLSSDKIGTYVYDSANVFIDCDTTLDTSWHHYAVTQDGTTIKMYRDGLLQDSYTYQNAVPDSNPLRIGAQSKSLERYFNGRIDDIRIYDYALTQSQVSWLYNKGEPVAYYRFDESSGTDAYDDTGNNNATVTIGATAPQTTIAAAHTASATGKYGRCMSFDGTDDYASVSSPSGLASGANPRTFSFWLYPNISQNKIIMGYGTNATSQLWDIMSYSGVIGIHFYSSDVSADFPNSLYTVGQWQHVAFTYDGTSVRSYINGVLKDTKVKSLSTVDSGVFKIGNGIYTSYNFFNGLIDDVRIYNYARTAGQVLQDYNAGVASRLGE
ncbi:MAG: LamG domain-containing protein [Candidatus Gorgyraea atricola]|nr:LamG domain-containing protein [Candidatus Gorgyraea atricola]